jgi:hypothetical protein
MHDTESLNAIQAHYLDILACCLLTISLKIHTLQLIRKLYQLDFQQSKCVSPKIPGNDAWR